MRYAQQTKIYHRSDTESTIGRTYKYLMFNLYRVVAKVQCNLQNQLNPLHYL